MHREEVQRSKPEAMRPDEFRNEGTPNFSEWAEPWGKPFWLLLTGPAFRAFVKK
jgi:hypothetical protein